MVVSVFNLLICLDLAKSGLIEGPIIVVALIDYHKVRCALFKIIIGSSLMFVGNLVGISTFVNIKKSVHHENERV